MNLPISPKTILIVDDEPLILEAMKMLLDFDCHTVETACDGHSALRKLESRHFDLVFTDLSMASMSGEALANAIKKKSPQQIVVMVTGRAESLDRTEIDPSSFDFRLSKPFQLPELRDIVRKATLKQAVNAPKSNLVSKQHWLTIQRHLHKGRE